jgi:hypothetical protein
LKDVEVANNSSNKNISQKEPRRKILITVLKRREKTL